ncbi:MAG: murein biosynthesis integral membrane protein MurJ [Proteobacteria bacterium]|nr:murein biosynthesis integral membrane protein MurJ [Pseudomonadota bacterium]
MLRNILSVGGLTLASRVLGFVRDVVTAALLGAGPVADAFFVALRLPNHFRALLAEGAFNAAFVPVFARLTVASGRPRALLFAEQVLALMVVSQLVLLVIFELVMPGFMHLFAPGFADQPEKFGLAVLFTRITFPYLLFIAIVSLTGALLNALGRFAAAAAAPILLNAILILAQLVLSAFLPTVGHALAWGVLAAGLAQFLFLLWSCHRAGVRLSLPRPRLTPDVRQFLRVLGPAALGAGVLQINLFADTLIASFLPTGAVSYLYYADRLNQLPLGVVGIAIGTVLLPAMSRHLKRGDTAAAAHDQNRAFELSLLLTLPAAVAFLAVAEPIVAVLFQRQSFVAADAAATAATLTAYAIGLPAFVLIRSVLPGFYAREDTATPVRIAVVAVAVNIGLKLVLMGPLLQVGLALATSLSSWLNFVLLALALRRRGFLALDARFKRGLLPLAAATVGMAIALKLAQLGLAPWFEIPGLTGRVAALAALIAIGGAVFATLALLLGAVDRAELRRVLRRRS